MHHTSNISTYLARYDTDFKPIDEKISKWPNGLYFISAVKGSSKMKVFGDDLDVIFTSSIRGFNYYSAKTIILKSFQINENVISRSTTYKLFEATNGIYQFSNSDIMFAPGQEKAFYFLNEYVNYLHLYKVGFANVESAQQLYVDKRVSIFLKGVKQEDIAIKDPLLKYIKDKTTG